MTLFFLLGFILLLMWLVLAAPIGQFTLVRRIKVRADADRVYSALHPFGKNFGWNEAARDVQTVDASSGIITTSHSDRSGGYIERGFELTEETDTGNWVMRYTSDTSLDQKFWDNYSFRTQIERETQSVTVVTIAETDRYIGLGFLVYRFFALRRFAIKFKKWSEEGTFEKGGLFEKPVTQLALAILSTLLLWPAFGLTQDGLLLSIALTVIVGLHELGHLLAFRLMGHKQVRMIFIPLLGGIAMGGRPYDRHFEIGFSALMGAGFSAIVVTLIMTLHGSLLASMGEAVLVFVLMAALFNLGNLIPVWKFDGGQVLRQIFRTGLGQAVSAFVILGCFLGLGYSVGVPSQALLVGGAIFALLSLFTSNRGVKPKKPLTPMNAPERVAIFAAFLAVFITHAALFLWSYDRLFA